MRRAISVRDAVDLTLAPLSVLGGIITVWLAPLADFVKWLVGGMLVVFVPMALIILYGEVGHHLAQHTRTSKGTEGIQLLLFSQGHMFRVTM